MTTIKIAATLTEDQIQQIYDSVSMILENTEENEWTITTETDDNKPVE